jgi:hypothetical protein
MITGERLWLSEEILYVILNPSALLSGIKAKRRPIGPGMTKIVIFLAGLSLLGCAPGGNYSKHPVEPPMQGQCVYFERKMVDNMFNR